MTGEAVLRGLWRTALAAVDPEALASRWLRAHPQRERRHGLFACGKAAVAMASGAMGSSDFDAALVVAPAGSRVPRGLARAMRFAAHPEPDPSSVAAAREAIDFFRSFGPGDAIVALISGGASSLLCLPRPGTGLAEKRRRVREAMRAGWPIDRLNRLRISLSAIKGGRLAEATRARVTTLILSDVPGGDFRLVGSGPTVSRRKRGDRAVLLGDNRTGIAAAARHARENGAQTRVLAAPVRGEARIVGVEFARRLRSLSGAHGRPALLLAGGETTVALSRRAGRGGRSQELALAAARELDGETDLAILAAGSDGIDGNSENAGAFIDGRTIARGRAAGASAEACLVRHDAERFFALAGGAFRPGPTGTNVADWIFGYAR